MLKFRICQLFRKPQVPKQLLGYPRETVSRCLCRQFDVGTNGNEIVVNNEVVLIYFDPATALYCLRPAGVAI